MFADGCFGEISSIDASEIKFLLSDVYLGVNLLLLLAEALIEPDVVGLLVCLLELFILPPFFDSRHLELVFFVVLEFEFAINLRVLQNSFDGFL